jgi:hypothetical protein
MNGRLEAPVSKMKEVRIQGVFALEEKLAGQKQIKVLESQRNQQVTTQVGAKSQLESELESQLESAPSGPKSAPSREEVGTKSGLSQDSSALP